MRLDAIAMGVRLADAAALARQVEACGFDGLWFTESGRPAYNPCVAAGLATERVDIGTAIAVAFPRSPMVTAQVAWDLADATGGRFVLGLGTQVKAHIERRYGVAFDRPGPRLREYVLALRAIFRAFQGEERLAFSGEFWSFDLLPDTWNPGPIAHPEVPVYVAAVRPWMARMAGEVADGIHLHPFHSRRYLDEVALPALAEGVAASGRGRDAVTVVCPVMVVTGDSDAELAAGREQARQRVAFYGSTRTYSGVFDVHGWEGTSARLHELQRAGDVAGMAAVITDDMLDAYVVTARWDGLAAALAARYGGVADRLVMYGSTASWARDPSSLDRWADVTRALRAATATP